MAHTEKIKEERTDAEELQNTVKKISNTEIVIPVKNKKQIPIWVPDEDLSTICEPIFNAALRIAFNTIVIEKGEKNIEIVSAAGCENFVPNDKTFTMEKSYPGLMPSKLENVISYAANIEEKAKINTMRFIDNNGLLISTDHLKTCNASSRPTCFLAKYCQYCFPAIARYIRYLAEYFPGEIERQRKKYQKNPYPAYQKLERFIFTIDDKELEHMEVPVKALETGKYLIDKAITLPCIVDNDEEKSYFITLYIPDCIKELINDNKLTIKNTKRKLTTDVFFEEKLDKNFINVNVPYNLMLGYIKKAFENPINQMNYLVAIVLLSYVLLQSGRYKSFLDKQKHREEMEDKKADALLKEYEINAKSQYHGMLINESQYIKKDIIRAISRKLQKNNDDIIPTIINLSFIQFLEMFSHHKEIDGYNHNFGLITGNYIPKNILYVLNDFKEIKYNLLNIAKGNNNEARIYRKGLEFLANPHKDIYILLDCTPEEKEKFYDLNEKYYYLFKPNEIILKDNTAETAYKKFTELGNRIKKDEFINHFEENSEQTPFKNDRYLEVLDMFYKSNRKLPTFNPRNGKNKETFHNALNHITGLQPIKDQLKRIYQYITFEKKARNEGLSLPPVNRHMLFKGNPGTGKTTVARIVAKMLYEGNIIKKDKFIECKSSDLIGQYVGETGQKTEHVIKKALDGVLFIDEAYALTYEYEYGKDAIATIVKEMEDKKDRLVIILAGYQKEMEHLVDQNPGMKSRIGYTFDFPDYSEEELVNIFDTKLKQIGFEIEDGVKEKIKKLIQTGKTQKHFGNGRFIDRIVQETIIEHAQHATDKDLKMIHETDIPTEEKLFGFKAKTKPNIGFKD